jgi:hypothetical protein
MGEIKGNGLSQGDLYTFLSNTATAVNELIDDVDAVKTILSEMITKLDTEGCVASGGSESWADAVGGDVPAAIGASDLSLII